MNTVKHRYSAEIQRTRGSWSWPPPSTTPLFLFTTTRAAEQAIQTESRVGYSLDSRAHGYARKGVSFSFAADGFRELPRGQPRQAARLDQSFSRRNHGLLGAKGYSPSGSRSGPSQYFLRTTSWALPFTSLPGSPRWPRSGRSGSRSDSPPEPSPRHGSNTARRCSP